MTANSEQELHERLSALVAEHGPFPVCVTPEGRRMDAHREMSRDVHVGYEMYAERAVQR